MVKNRLYFVLATAFIQYVCVYVYLRENLDIDIVYIFKKNSLVCRSTAALLYIV